MSKSDNESPEARLRDTLFTVYPQEPIPGGEELITCGCSECLGLRDTLSGKRWGDLTYDEIFEQQCSLPLLTLRAHHYYLPAYLRLGLGPEGCGAEWTIYDLCQDGGCERIETRFGLFSDPQKHVVAAWLKFILEQNVPGLVDYEAGWKGFNAYWCRYL